MRQAQIDLMQAIKTFPLDRRTLDLLRRGVRSMSDAEARAAQQNLTAWVSDVSHNPEEVAHIGNAGAQRAEADANAYKSKYAARLATARNRPRKIPVASGA